MPRSVRNDCRKFFGKETRRWIRERQRFLSSLGREKKTFRDVELYSCVVKLSFSFLKKVIFFYKVFRRVNSSIRFHLLIDRDIFMSVKKCKRMR